MFIVVTIIMSPVIYIYTKGSFFDREGGVYSTFLGNLGGTHMICEHQRLEAESVELKCDKGFVLDTDHAVFGVISNEFKFFGLCTEKAINRRIAEKEYQSCSRHMD